MWKEEAKINKGINKNRLIYWLEDDFIDRLKDSVKCKQMINGHINKDI